MGTDPHVEMAAMLASGQRGAKKPCYHDSGRIDGTLDSCCLACGADGYWHRGERLDEVHPSGKILFRLPQLERPAQGSQSSGLQGRQTSPSGPLGSSHDSPTEHAIYYGDRRPDCKPTGGIQE